MPTRTVLCLAAAVVCVSACSVTQPGSAAVAAEAIPQASSTGVAALPGHVDLDALMRRAHFAFRAEDGARGWVGGHTTYRSRVTPGGAVRVEPLSTPLEKSRSVLEVRTQALTLGAVRLGTALDAREREGAVVLRRAPGVEELIENREEGVEQRWRFATRPGTRGDALRLELAVGGAPFLATTRAGHHFGVPGAGLVRYGSASWVDAAGRRTAIPVVRSGTQLTMTVPAAVLDASTWPAELDPLLTPETAIDQPVVGAAFGIQESPDVAHAANQFLLVWADTKSINGAGVSRLVGARIDATGALVDPVGVVLYEDSLGISLPAVASDGTSYLVAFNHDVSGTTPRVWTVAVSAAGVPSGAREVTTGSDVQQLGGLAYGGGTWLLTWEEGQSPLRDIKAARLNAAGVPQGAPVSVGPTTGDQWHPRVAYDGTSVFLVTWQDDEGSTVVRAAGISTAGVLLNGPDAGVPLSDGGAPWIPSVAFNGATFDVGWADFVSGAVTVVPVAPTGTVGAPLPLPTLTNVNSDVHVVSGNGAALLLYTDGTDGSLRGVRLSSTGAVPDSSAFVIAANAQRNSDHGAAAYDDSRGRWLVGWRSSLWTTSILQDPVAIRGAFVSAASGATSGLGVLSKSNNGEAFSSVTYAAQTDTWFAVWNDLRGDLSVVRGARFGADGAVKDVTGIDIASSPTDSYLAPMAASDGKNFLVTWATDLGPPVQVVRVDGVTGAVLDATPKVVSTGSGQVHAARVAAMKGGDYLVTWLDDSRQLGCSGFLVFCGDVMAAKVRSSDGQVAWRTNTHGWGQTFLVGPASAFDGVENNLVSWVAWPSGVTQATRLDGSGTVLDAPPLDLSPGLAQFVHVSAGAGQSLVVFGADDGGVYWTGARRVAFDGTLPDGDAGVISMATSTNYLPSSAWDGHDWLVGWNRGERVLDLSETQTGLVRRFDATTLAPLGPELVLGASKGNVPVPTLASDGKGTTAVLYVSDDADAGVPRVHLRFLRAYAPGHVCAQDAECRVGACVEGVCCASACTGACQTCLQAQGAPADGVCGFRPATSVCRPDAGVCDVAEHCTGAAPDCPANAFAPATTTCRPAAGVCDVAETCPGDSAACPTDAFAADTTACGASGQCTLAGACQAGQCVGAHPRVCAAASECREAAVCGEPDGCSTGTPKADGTACTQGHCASGECVADPPQGPKSFVAFLSCASVPEASVPAAWGLLWWLRRGRGRRGGGR